MPTKGQKIFRISYCIIDKKPTIVETVVFLEESLVGKDCTSKTWLVKDKVIMEPWRCSIGMYEESEKEAWEKFEKELENGIQCTQETIQKAQLDLHDLVILKFQTSERLASLKG